MAFLLFIFVIGMWLYSSRNLIGNALAFLGVKKEYQNPITAKNQDIQLNEGLFYSRADASTPTPTLDTNSIVKDIVNEIQSGIPTYTPYPTFTPYPTYTPYPISTNDTITNNTSIGYPDFIVKGKISYYWPPLGGINCDSINGVEECDHVANGDLYTVWVGIGVACPESLPFFTRIYIPEIDRDFVCVDRGGLIYVDADNFYWFDILNSEPLLPYGTITDVLVYLPR